MKHKIIATTIQKEIGIGSLCKNNIGTYGVCNSIKFEELIDCTPRFQTYKGECSNQQLLLLSNEGSNKGELTVFTNCSNDKIVKYNNPIKAKHNYASNGLYNFKVIAVYPKLDNIPTFSIDFVKDWCENPVEEVNVRYFKRFLGYEDISGLQMFEDALQLTSNNEVICLISAKFKILSKEEVEQDRSSAYEYLDFEDSIEKAAKEFCKGTTFSEFVFISGAKSEAAKEYWYEKFKPLFYDAAKSQLAPIINIDLFNECFEEWFEQNSK